MKKSEQFKQEASEQESDLAALGKMTKALREERSERFEEDWYDKFLEVLGTIHNFDDGTRYVFESKQHGKMTFYPKANKVLVHKQNIWHKPGLRWLINTYLKK